MFNTLFYKKYQLSFLAVCLSLYGISQTVPPPKIESPNAGTIDKYNQIPVNLFTGTPGIDIPIHTLKYGSINVPIGLRYHPGSVKPLAHPGWVGLGWDLESIGSITRTIHNRPDEYSVVQTNMSTIDPYYPLPYTNPYGKSGSEQVAIAGWNTTSQLSTYYTTQSGSYVADVEADEFSFNFMGHSGKFYYEGPANGWQVVSDENIQVVLNPSPNDFLAPADVDNAIGQYAQGPGLNSFISNNSAWQSRMFNSFTLTVPDGTKYLFGGANAIEFYSSYGVSNTNPSGYPEFFANTWLLKSIIDVNNNEVDFNYRRSYPTCDLSISSYNNKYNCSQLANGNLLYGSSNSALQSQMGTVNSSQYSGYFHWSMYLNTITSPNETIQFTGGVATCLRYSNIQLLSLGTGNTASPQFVNSIMNNNLNNIQWEQLNGITITNSNNNIYRQYSFNYTPAAGAGALPNQRLMLYSFNESDNTNTLVRQYSFSYNNEAGLPLYDGDNTDHWGYYNGQSVSNIAVSQAPTTRATNATNVLTGLLTRITYPTGGYSKLTWEAHDYSQYILPGGRSTALTAASGTPLAGGSRIIDISNYLVDNTLASEKKYIYKRGYTNGSTVSSLISSGILNGLPQYVFDIQNRPGNQGAVLFSIHLESLNPMSSYSYNSADSYIGYDEVAEINLDGSYTKHYFTSYGTDLNGVSHYDQVPAGSIGWAVTDNYFPYSTLDRERGKSVADCDYNAANILVHKTAYTYRSDAARFNNYVKRIDHSNTFSNAACSLVDALTFAVANTVFNYTYYPVTKTSTVYDQSGNNPVVVSESYTYNSNNLISSKVFTNSKGEGIITNYSYPTDLTSQSVCQQMVNAHIISPVLGTSVWNLGSSSNSVENQVSTTVANYYSPYASQFQPQNIQAQVSANPLETRQQFYQYDIHGNVQEMSKTNDIHEVYLWGYNSQYPVAKITGSTYGNVKQYVVQASLDAATTDAQMVAALAPLRTAISATVSPATALITTYTYAPVIGMTSQTDPAGRTNYYRYDAFGRLSYILDQDKNVVKRYAYNYAGQPENTTIPAPYSNALLTQTFTKTGCPSGTTAPAYNYTVPAGKYTSFTDGIVNTQALNDLNTNGQAGANALPCLATISSSNTTTVPFTIVCSNTSTGVSTTYTSYNGSTSVVTLGNLPVGTYNITITPYSSYSATLLLNGLTYTGASFNLSNISITTATSIVLQPSAVSASCSFIMASGYSSPTNSIANNGTTASGYLTFYSGSTMSAGSTYTVATINGGCKPSAARSLTATSGGRTFAMTFNTNGSVTVQIVYSSASLNPNTTVSLSFSYNL